MRRQYTQHLLALTREDIIRAAKKYLDATGVRQGVAVISSEEKLEAANQRLAENPLSLHAI